MRISSVLFAAAVALVSMTPAAFAYENFIPLGQSYTPDEHTLPKLGSERDRFNAQVDIYESQIYNRERNQKILSSRMEQFSNDHEFTGRSGFIDY